MGLLARVLFETEFQFVWCFLEWSKLDLTFWLYYVVCINTGLIRIFFVCRGDLRRLLKISGCHNHELLLRFFAFSEHIFTVHCYINCCRCVCHLTCWTRPWLYQTTNSFMPLFQNSLGTKIHHLIRSVTVSNSRLVTVYLCLCLLQTTVLMNLYRSPPSTSCLVSLWVNSLSISILV